MHVAQCYWCRVHHSHHGRHTESTGHIIRHVNTDPGWVPFLRKGGFYANFSITAVGFITFMSISARLSCFSTLFHVRCPVLYTVYRACRNPFEPKERMVKRLLAIDGDLVRPMGNNKREVLRVPQGHCWVEGDSIGISGDSNQFGPVSCL